MKTAEDLQHNLSNPIWRLNNLYSIVVKEPDDDITEGKVVKFKLNAVQMLLVLNLWFRNIIPKARQLGVTSFSCIYALDSCIFSKNFQAGIIAQTDGVAKKLFRDKVLFAYEQLPVEIRTAMPLKKQTESELIFDNDSSILVSTSMRSGTINFLHVSEFGPICALFPQRAKEIITGSLPAVPNSGVVIIESTAKGKDGAFYKMTMRAKGLAEQGKKLTKKDYRLHFFPWFAGDDNVMSPEGVLITDKDNAYFDEVETKADTVLSIEQRAWYCATRDNEFSGEDEEMWRENPSHVDECFQVSTEGCYFSKQFVSVRKQGRLIPEFPVPPSVACWTFWDIGSTDGTAVWVIQKVGVEYRCVHFYESWGEPYEHAVKWLQSLGLVWSDMWLPHDATHVRQGMNKNQSPRQMLEKLMPGVEWKVVPVIGETIWGINQTRDVFPMLYFHQKNCKLGIEHLESYRKKWNERLGTWSKDPDKTGGHSEAADALRQFGQAYAAGLLNVAKYKPPKFTPQPTTNRW